MMRSNNTLWGLLGVAAVAGVALWYFRKRDSYVSVEPVSNNNGMAPSAGVFLPSTFTPSYIPVDITQPGGGTRILQSALANPNPSYAATIQVP